jgi:hypothetical protein
MDDGSVVAVGTADLKSLLYMNQRRKQQIIVVAAMIGEKSYFTQNALSGGCETASNYLRF